MAVVSLQQLLDKTLFAAKKVNLFTYPVADSKYFYNSVSAGNAIGQMYSYVTQKGVIWLQIYSTGGKYLYMVYTADSIELKSLKEQGVKTEEEKQQEKADENKKWYEKLGESIGDFIPKAALAVGAFIILRDIVKAKVK